MDQGSGAGTQQHSRVSPVCSGGYPSYRHLAEDSPPLLQGKTGSLDKVWGLVRVEVGSSLDNSWGRSPFSLRVCFIVLEPHPAYTESCQERIQGLPTNQAQRPSSQFGDMGRYEGETMLQQARMSRDYEGLEQLKPDLSGMHTLHRIHLEVDRLVVARYFIIIMGAVLLLSLAAQALFFDGGVSFSRVLKVALVSVLGPGLIWAASDKEVRLLKELAKRNRQLEQRVQENKALNRMTQAHLADCLTEAPSYHAAPPRHRVLPDSQEMFTESAQAEVRSDFQNVIVLDPDDDSYDRRYFEPAGSARTTIINGSV